MFKVIQQLFIIGILTCAFLMTSCASNPSMPKNIDITLETVDSSSAEIAHAFISQGKNKLFLRGELSRKISGRGPIPGHLHIALLDAADNVLLESNAGYERMSIKSDTAHFVVPLPSDLSTIKKIRITHHDIVSHEQTTHDVEWKNPVK